MIVWLFGILGLGGGGFALLGFLLPELGLFGKAAKVGGSALKWLGSLDLVHLCLLVAVLFGEWQTVGRWSQHRHTTKVEGQLTAATSALTAERKGRAADRQAYQQAQAQAAAQNKSQVAGTEATWKGKATNERQSFLDDLAALRAANQRLRQQADGSAQRPAGEGGTSPPATDSAGAYGDGLQVHQTADVQAQRDEDAAEIELRLMHLQHLVQQLVAVDPNKEPKP